MSGQNSGGPLGLGRAAATRGDDTVLCSEYTKIYEVGDYRSIERGHSSEGISALQLGRDLEVQYKTAFVLAHRLREAISAVQTEGTLTGEVEIDGAYIGGHMKPANEGSTASRAKDENGKPQSLVVAP